MTNLTLEPKNYNLDLKWYTEFYENEVIREMTNLVNSVKYGGFKDDDFTTLRLLKGDIERLLALEHMHCFLS